MRVTFVLPGYAREPGGGIRVVYSLANGLADRGHQVVVQHLAYFRRRPSLARRLMRAQAAEIVGGTRDVLRGPPKKITWQKINPGVELRYVSHLSPRTVPDGDVVVATAWQTAESVARLPLSKGRGHYLVQGLETWSGTEERVDATWGLPLRKIFIAPWLLERGAALGLKDLHRIPAGIDTQRFRVEQSVTARPKRVVMLYSHWPDKGAREGILALQSARARVRDLDAVFFGLGPRPADLPKWIDYQQNPSQERLVSEIYNASSIYLCPSRSEGWHLPPAEAMACGCALVSTDIQGVREYAMPNVTALLSPPRDEVLLGDNLVRLASNDALRHQMAQAGNTFIREYTWERSTREFEAIARMPA